MSVTGDEDGTNKSQQQATDTAAVNGGLAAGGDGDNVSGSEGQPSSKRPRLEPQPLKVTARTDGSASGEEKGGAANAASSGSNGSGAAIPVTVAEDTNWRERAEKIAKGQKLNKVEPTSKYKYAMLCSSNVNRSVLAQIVLEREGVAVASYGVNHSVAMPGKSRASPTVFPFGTPYLEMHDKLLATDKDLHARAALLKLLSRDACTKRHPERWQDLGSADAAKFDIIICFNDKIFDLCIEDFQNRPPFEFKPIHIVSLPVMDTPQHAEQAMVDVLKLVKMLDACDDVESQGADVVEAFQATTKRPILHQVCHL
eukprot:TRINITY_DN4964_c0_g1_i1.p1 TRINITY_DN4964_c0_g1~~TRINITY_DN4964_c0_g1_i1.p1  ORF type:complete len:313 (-),score=73.28 TRINITY_DN4964_c0_g1_i1:130-1068(-)